MKTIQQRIDAIRFPAAANRIPPIRAELVAAKLQAIRSFKYPDILDQIVERPRLVELLWFILAMSMLPGGLERFTRDFVASFWRIIYADALGLIEQHDAGGYRLEQCLSIWKKLNGPDLYSDSPVDNLLGDTWLFEQLLGENVEGIRAAEKRGTEAVLKIVQTLTPAYFEDLLLREALDAIPGYLASLCNEVDKGFCRGVAKKGFEEYHLGDLIPALIEMMDLHARRVSAALAETKVAKLVFGELDYAIRASVPVAILGDSRYGKTKAVSTWCEMRPGRARLVTVPFESNNEFDFFKAHATALGIDHDEKTSLKVLKARVEYVLDHAGLFISYDEAHALFPSVFSQNTPPKRLNWIRRRIIDRRLGCAFFATRQTYNVSLAKFVRKTGYVMEQWLGRMDKPLMLPADMSLEDLQAAGAVNFPEMDPDIRDLIAVKSMQSEGYLANFELLAKRALYYAQVAGRAQVTIADVERAYTRNFGDSLIQPKGKAKAPPQASHRSDLEPPQPVFSAAERRRDSAVATGASEEFAGRREISPLPARLKARAATVVADPVQTVLV